MPQWSAKDKLQQGGYDGWYMQENKRSVADLAARLGELLGTYEQKNAWDDVESLKYVLYARKSTDESGKQERSLEDQIAAGLELKDRLNLNVVDTIIEAKSAKLSGNRPKFEAMLKSILNGKYDAILTWAPDRLARNMKDAGEILDLLDKNDIADIKFANGYYFQNDGMGKMMLGMAFVQAKQFIDIHSQNVRRGIRRITSEGKVYDRPKNGYYKDKNGYLQPDGKNWELLRQAFHMRLSEPRYPLKEIAVWLTEQGFPVETEHAKHRPIKINEKFLSDIFRNPVYAGVLIHGKGQPVDLVEKAGFRPMITPDEFDKLTEIDGISKRFVLAEIIKPKGSVQADLMRGMVTCAGCDRTRSTGLTTKKTKGGVTNYFFFRCDSKGCRYKGKSVRAKTVLEAAYDFLEKHPMNLEKGYKNYKTEMERIIPEQNKELSARIRSVQKQCEFAKKKRQNTQELLEENAKDAVLASVFKENLKTHITNEKGLEKELRDLHRKRDRAKDAIFTFEEFIELFGNLAKNIQKIKVMTQLDFIMKKVFMNFVVDGKKVVQITQNSLFRELCGLPNPADSVMVARRGIEPLFSP